jgi:hypothetical protein
VRQPFGSEKENVLEKINEYTKKNIECEQRQDDGYNHATIYTIKLSLKTSLHSELVCP